MQRFRRKSDAKRSPTNSYSQLSSPSVEYLSDSLPELPALSDFRTSLILPDLSRRFTILRSSTADSHLIVDALKSRLAHQRETGAENHIVEEDEDMILDSLGLRAKIWSSAEKSEDSISTSASSSPSGRKRYSNNLFGSGKFRDHAYIRNVAQSRSSKQSAASKPDDPTDTSIQDNGVRSAPLIPPAPYGEQTLSAAEYRLSKTLGPAALKRASMALEEAIREMEEEAEDQIVMPRSAPMSRTSFDQESEPEPGTAISSDKQIRTDLEERRVSPIPSRTVPGYIPGMPRPMTPRENMEVEEQRSHSTTPRATSPMADNTGVVPPSLVTSLVRRDSTPSSPRYSPRPMSPPFIQRTTNTGTDDSNRSGELSPDFEFPPTGIVRRRPASPLSGPSYQPLAVSPVSSRPGTPSNGTWVSPPTNQKSSFEHNRNGSWFSDGNSEPPSPEQSNPPRSLMKSPALPDSPVIDNRGHSNMTSFGSSQSSSSQSLENRSPSSLSGPIDLGFALTTMKPVRSPTPTQRSPSSPTFPSDLSPGNPRPSSRQNPFPSAISTFIPIMLSPIASSSRSSLESAGSSYHSWEGEKDRTYSLFTDSDTTQPSWHDISISEQSSSTTPGGSPGDEWDAEDVISKYAGLKKSDFMAIQGKLVSVASAKVSPDRNSSLRRRRPSTSQSNYSITGSKVTSPQPPVQPTAPPPVSFTTNEQYSPSSVQAQNALLNAIVDSIQSPKINVNPPLGPSEEPSLSPKRDVSPSSRRNRDLAQILFGQDNENEQLLSPKSFATDTMSSPVQPLVPRASTDPPYPLSRNPSSPKLPQTAEEQAELAREVQRRTEAAMAALKKQSSTTNLVEGFAPSPGSVRKRISPNQISTPTLVSASTSVDTIPLRTPSITGSQSTSKLGSRFRKLRGTLRKSAISPSGEEVTPYPLDLHSPTSQTIHYDSGNVTVPGATPPASATEPGRYKVLVPSPPASAGPGLKGFMARFRGNKQRSDYTDSDAHMSPLSPGSDSRISPLSPGSVPQLPLPDHLAQTQRPRGPPTTNSTGIVSPSQQVASPSSLSSLSSVPADESLALKQLFDAASNLGLDQEKLNDLLLVRSPSSATSSKQTDLTVLGSTPNRNDNPPGPRRASIDSPLSRNASASRKASTRKPADFLRKPREGQELANPVVRRTILFPSDTNVDLNTLVRKTSGRRRRVSATSMSSRSVHDRVPTPPPRSPTSKRFSTEASPPVPQLPRSFTSRGESLLGVGPAVPLEKSTSTYDSLYDMYTEDVKAPAAPLNESSHPNGSSETGPALEVLELANGEVIWNIVNGLRDEDSESIYPRRGSFASEYEPDESVKVYFREHTRNTSKGSASSIVSRKRHPTNNNRPETQVYMTPSAQIGRLIEDLSQGMEAGSFNFSGAHGHSTTSSISENDMNWTVEERLEHMLGAMRNS